MDDATMPETRTRSGARPPSDRRLDRPDCAGVEYADEYSDDHADEHYDEHEAGADDSRLGWEIGDDRPRPASYRPGRGGYDPEAAALAAQARYTFRQRMVLLLVLFAGLSALLAATLRMTDAWYLHGAVDLGLLGYLWYLRRQVRMEQAIRVRRAARMAGSRAGTVADGARGSQWRAGGASTSGDRRAPGAAARGARTTVAEAYAAREAQRRQTARMAAGDPGGDLGERAADGAATGAAATGAGAGGVAFDAWDGAGEQAGEGAEADGSERQLIEDDFEEQVPALAQLTPSRTPTPPPGTVRLELDDEDPELHDLADWQPRGYRRAAGQ